MPVVEESRGAGGPSPAEFLVPVQVPVPLDRPGGDERKTAFKARGILLERGEASAAEVHDLGGRVAHRRRPREADRAEGPFPVGGGQAHRAPFPSEETERFRPDVFQFGAAELFQDVLAGRPVGLRSGEAPLRKRRQGGEPLSQAVFHPGGADQLRLPVQHQVHRRKYSGNRDTDAGATIHHANGQGFALVWSARCWRS